jgi:hypothetical protein
LYNAVVIYLRTGKKLIKRRIPIGRLQIPKAIDAIAPYAPRCYRLRLHVAFHVVLDSITAKAEYNTPIAAVVVRTNSLRRSLG